jgi:hypothetical protein
MANILEQQHNEASKKQWATFLEQEHNKAATSTQLGYNFSAT